MNFQLALSLTVQLLAFTMVIQALEVLLLTKNKEFLEIWSFENLRPQLEKGLPLPKTWIAKIFSIQGLRLISVLQIAVAAACAFNPHPALIVFLLISHLLICIRFRGTFNGGSDMMTVIVLTGVLISLSATSAFIQKLGLIYLSIHTLYSYFKAGLFKVIHLDWRTGRALPAFLDRSIYPDIRAISRWVQKKPGLSLTLSWAVLVFELGSLGLLLHPNLRFTYFVLALIFHFINFLNFGLNRFFWIWLSAWPAVIFSLGLIGI